AFGDKVVFPLAAKSKGHINQCILTRFIFFVSPLYEFFYGHIKRPVIHICHHSPGLKFIFTQLHWLFIAQIFILPGFCYLKKMSCGKKRMFNLAFSYMYYSFFAKISR